MLLDAQNGRKRKPEVIAKTTVMIIIYQETVYTDISLCKLFFVIVFYVRSDQHIPVRNYSTILAAEVEINIGRKIDACY